ncbi:MAG TPA: hypothetical protein VM911_20655 [Pyrinomonadaceae bacterium]|jgi:hypothetical protein|nr:hypothetical protein [Pyrinomonadaceae bacterium]
MKKDRTGIARNHLRLLPLSLMLIVAAATPLLAQRDRNKSLADKNRNSRVAFSEWQRTHMAEVAEKQFKKRRLSLLPLIKEDFTRIQVVNNEMMRKIFDDEVLDYKRISESIGEIRKRATRLRENLMLPETEPGDKSLRTLGPTQSALLKDSLLRLDNMIMAFVRNPLFQQPNVVDAKLSAKAGDDLKTIIEFSGGIRKEAEKLSKLQGRP